MKKFMLALLFLAFNASAMQGQNWYKEFNDWFGEEFIIKADHEYHSDRINRIIIGHRPNIVSDLEKLKADGQKIVYHFCLSIDGKCYEGRPLSIKPAFLSGYNDQTCAVGLLYDTRENINAYLVDSWARMIAWI